MRSCADVLLKRDGGHVDKVHPHGDQGTSGRCEPQRSSEEVHRRADIHGVGEDREREAGDHLVHQDAKVVSQVGARDAESIERRQYQDRASRREHVRSDVGCRLELLTESHRGLIEHGLGEAAGTRTPQQSEKSNMERYLDIYARNRKTNNEIS